MERSASGWKIRTSELERDEAREFAVTARGPYLVLERTYRKEVAEHKETRELLNKARVRAIVLLALLVAGVLLWWLVLR